MTVGPDYCEYSADTRYIDTSYADSNKDNAAAGPLYSTFDSRVFASSTVAPTSLGSQSLFYDSSWADAVDGHRWQWLGGAGIPTVSSGSLTVWWHVGGFISTKTDGSPVGVPGQPPGAGSSEATGDLEINVDVLDETAGATIASANDASFTRDDSGAGDQSQVYEKSGVNTFSVSYTTNHIYRPYIDAYALSTSRAGYILVGPVPFFLDANSNVDFFDGQGGGFMDNVEYQVNLPTGYYMSSCS